MKKVGANCGYWEKSNLCERQQGEERICPIMGRVAINGTMVRFSSVASELFVFMVKTPIWGMIIFLKCRVYDSISMGNGGKVNGIEVLSQ